MAGRRLVATVISAAFVVAGQTPVAQETPDTTPPSCEKLQSKAKEGQLEAWMSEEGGVFDEIVESPETYRAQVLVNEVVPRKGASDCLIERGYRTDAEYVYPASAIKTVGAVAALRLVMERARRDLDARLGLDSVLWYRRPENFDDLESTEYHWKLGGTLREIIEKTLVVSSNEDFNKLYDLVGHRALNEWMWEAGLESLRMKHRMFSKRTVEEQKWTPKVGVGESEERKTVRPARRSDLELEETPASRIEVGETHVDFITGEYREEPMDFSDKNYISVRDLQRLMLGILRPDLADVDFYGLDTYRGFLKRTLATHPDAESEEEKRNLVRRFSPMYPGFSDVVGEERLEYVNKAGRAYGFHLDNAYVVDEKTGRELFVTAVIYVNENEKLNDNQYQYEEKSYPFLEGVGRVVAKHLLSSNQK